MKIGEIDVPNSIVNLEHDVNVLQQAFNFIIANNPNIRVPNAQQVEQFKKNAIEVLQKKYPNMGIKQQ